MVLVGIPIDYFAGPPGEKGGGSVGGICPSPRFPGCGAIEARIADRLRTSKRGKGEKGGKGKKLGATNLLRCPYAQPRGRVSLLGMS